MILSLTIGHCSLFIQRISLLRQTFFLTSFEKTREFCENSEQFREKCSFLSSLFFKRSRLLTRLSNKTSDWKRARLHSTWRVRSRVIAWNRDIIEPDSPVCFESGSRFTRRETCGSRFGMGSIWRNATERKEALFCFSFLVFSTARDSQVGLACFAHAFEDNEISESLVLSFVS